MNDPERAHFKLTSREGAILRVYKEKDSLVTFEFAGQHKNAMAPVAVQFHASDAEALGGYLKR